MGPIVLGTEKFVCWMDKKAHGCCIAFLLLASASFILPCCMVVPLLWRSMTRQMTRVAASLAHSVPLAIMAANSLITYSPPPTPSSWRSRMGQHAALGAGMGDSFESFSGTSDSPSNRNKGRSRGVPQLPAWQDGGGGERGVASNHHSEPHCSNPPRAKP
jgi:hypothetical protein